MTDSAPEASEATLLAYDAVLDAADALDAAATRRAASHLAGALASEPDELVDEAAVALMEAWANAEDIWTDDAEDVLDRRRGLLIEALMILGDSFPRPTFAGAYELAALDRLADDPAAAVTLADQAAVLAADADEAAGYRAIQAMAIGALGRIDEALRIARDARAAASRLETVDEIDLVILEIMLELRPADAAGPAMEVFQRRGPDMPDRLAGAVIRALLVESGRLEARHEQPPAEMATAFRLALDRPAWRPDFLTEADWAVIVAWIDFLRDDRALLAETLARTRGGPYSELSLEGYAALLEVMVAFDAMDLPEMERRLRRAGPLVERAGDSKLSGTYRAVVGEVVRARGLDLQKSAAPPAAPAEWEQREEIVLYRQAQAQIAAQKPTPETLARLRAWREAGGVAGDAMMTGALWVLAAAGALYERDLAAARECVAQARDLTARFPADSAAARWLAVLLDGSETALLATADLDVALARLRASRERHADGGNEFVAAVCDAQLAMLQVSRDPQEALACAVRAMTSLRRRRVSLAGSSEREAMRESLEAHPQVAALHAAAAIDDPRTTAELLEFLRSQDLPLVPEDPDPTQLPLALLVPPPAGTVVFFPDDPAASTDVVTLDEPAPVRMPWGRLALQDLVGPQAKAPVPLVVPR